MLIKYIIIITNNNFMKKEKLLNKQKSGLIFFRYFFVNSYIISLGFFNDNIRKSSNDFIIFYKFIIY